MPTQTVSSPTRRRGSVSGLSLSSSTRTVAVPLASRGDESRLTLTHGGMEVADR